MASVRWYNACAAYAVELAQGLVEQGHEVLVLVEPGSPAESEARSRRLRVEAGFDLTERHPGRALSNLRALHRVIEAFDPHVVNAHRSEDHLFAALALRGSNRPLVRTRGDVRPPKRHPANRTLYRRATAAHVACADFMPPRFYAPLGIDPERIHIIRPGLDVERFARGAPPTEEARRRLELDPGVPWVGLVGRWTAAKGHGTLLRAMSAVRTTPLPHVFLTGIPNEITEKDLRREAAELGLDDRLRIASRLPDVRVALRALDVLAVPSVASEAISRIAMEGLALGVPTVASDLNSLPEVVGPAGLLVPPGDPRGLAEAVTRFLEDPRRRAEARGQGPQRIERRYRRDVQIRKTEELFRALIHRRGSS
jgi:glycosyltransferase involved in cell wall biosynthesis